MSDEMCPPCRLGDHDNHQTEVMDHVPCACDCARKGITLTRAQLEIWANYPGEPVKLSDETVARLAEAIPNSSIPEAIAAIVSDALGVTWCQFCRAELYDFEGKLYARYPKPGTPAYICLEAPDDGTYPEHEA